MADPYRPTPDQIRSFTALAEEVRDHADVYLEAARWFATEYSLKAIDARREAAMLPVEREVRDEYLRAGLELRERQDPSGYMERLLRAVEHLAQIDDSALPGPDRMEHYRRAVLVGALLTDPDLLEGAPTLAAALGMDRSHWPSRKALVDGGEAVDLNRWWAREEVFGSGGGSYRPFEPLLERAVSAASTVAEVPASEGPRFDAAALNDPDRAILLVLEAARREVPPRALDGGEIASAVKRRFRYNFRDARHVRQSVESLRKRGWPIPNAHNRTGYRLGQPLAELCPDLATLV